MIEFLNKTIVAHVAWKGRLRSAIEGGELPDAAMIRADDQCDLGKWICKIGTSYQHLPEFQELKSQHARFHRVAADVIEMIEKGDADMAHSELESGDYAKASMQVIAAIGNLRNKIDRS